VTDLRWWTRPRRVIRTERLEGDIGEPRSFIDHEPPNGVGIKVFNATAGADPGVAAYRFHSAINETTPHASLYAQYGDMSWLAPDRQLDMGRDMAECREAIRECDVLHSHMSYVVAEVTKTVRTGQHPNSHGWLLSHFEHSPGVLVHHYHGSVAPGQPTLADNFELVDRDFDAIRVGARLTHLTWGDDFEWVPITVPVRRYYALRDHLRPTGIPGVDRPFRIGHSPTLRAIKGTADFEAVVADLRAGGVNVEAVLIEKKRHGEALAMKATCDAVFDSFSLGIQGSGLEAGAMGLPVIAGDPEVRALYEQHVGMCPYVFANSRSDLAEAIYWLAHDRDGRQQAAETVGWYVWAYHSYGAVAARYLAMLARRAPHLAERIADAWYVTPTTCPQTEDYSERPTGLWRSAHPRYAIPFARPDGMREPPSFVASAELAAV